MKIFVSGATGYLGYHFVKVAINQGHEVLCLRRPTSRSLFEAEIENKVKWVVNDEELKSAVIDFQPDELL